MNKAVWNANFSLSIALMFVGLAFQIATIFTPDYWVERIAYWTISVANLIAINYLYRHGRFSRSRWKNLIYLLFGFFMLGAIFKMQHWPGSTMIMAGSFLILSLCYALWFLTKPVKQLLDYLKLLWMVAYGVLAFLRTMNLYYSTAIKVIFISSVLYFIYIKFHVERVLHPVVPKSEWDFDKESSNG